MKKIIGILITVLFLSGCIIKVYIGKTDIDVLSAEAKDNKASMFTKEVKE